MMGKMSVPMRTVLGIVLGMVFTLVTVFINVNMPDHIHNPTRFILITAGVFVLTWWYLVLDCYPLGVLGRKS